MLCLEIVVVEAVKQEVHQIRHHGFRSFGFQKLYDMVICQGREFDKDFSYDSYLWLFDIPSLQTVKIADDSLDVPAKLHHSCRALGQGGDTAFLPFFMERICASRNCFIRSGRVENPHKDIAVYHRLHSLCKQRKGDGKARIGFHAVCIDGNHRNLAHAGFFKGTADKAYVVGGAASASGLGHKDGCTV